MPMKCIKTTKGNVLRLSNEEANSIVTKGLAYYVAKNVWKAQRALEQKEQK